MTTPLFRSDGTYWGFLAGDRVYDRYGRDVGWLEGTDVYHRSGRFMGELVHRHYVLRNMLRSEPIHREPRPPVPYSTPPAPPPNRGARDPLDDWNDALPWPLSPPEPPRL
ncbi:MAG: hypothetical protein HY002_10925 [Candidatus Rokubacteria bacterium]|nr:hypothetical protein [Candidatus Rokubacteria bacterium]